MRRCSPLLVLGALLASAAPAAAPAEPARRVVSMNPSLTAILIALGAGSSLVGVEEQSARLYPEVGALPTVGGLFNPSLEAVVALEPDLVILVPSAQQRGFRERLAAFGIAVLELPNIGFDQVLETIETLGARVGRAGAARARIDRIRSVRAEVAAATAGLPRRRAVVVVQREPLYVAGRGSFIDEMLRGAGAENAAAALSDPYPRTGVEWLIAAAPEVILDATEGSPDPAQYWSRWPSIPAVTAGRVVAIPPDWVTMPGPDLDRGLRLLAEILHGPTLRLPARP